MNLKELTHVYLIGIGGIGMSALARYFKNKGLYVAGYDRTETTLTQALQNEGINVVYQDDIAKIPRDFLVKNNYKKLVIFTPAIPQNSAILQYFQQNNYILHKRAEVLSWITEGSYTIAVAGTHGKTSTTAMIAHLWQYAQKPVNAFMGGISQNYHTNLLLSTEEIHKTTTIVEADEYDKSFLRLKPHVIVLNSIEPDHLDIYQNEKNIQDTYQEFVEKIQDGGSIFIRKGIEKILNFDFIKAKNVALYTFGLEEKADFEATKVRIENAQFVFQLNHAGSIIDTDITLQTAGFHNVINATAALAVAHTLGINWVNALQGIQTYLGVKRRFQYLVKKQNSILIDDYAHHPTEVATFIQSVRKLYPNQKITAIFQPHLYTRTRDFMQGFAESLSLADELWLLPIYPARELPIENVNSDKLLDLVSLNNKYLFDKEQVKKIVSTQKIDVLLTIGAGDIEVLAEELAHILA